MMWFTVSIKWLWIGLFCFASIAGWAAPVEKIVVVEIDTTGMTEETVENVSEPIEILLGSLDEVFMLSAKYRTNRATINVKFLEVSVDPEILMARVKATIDRYLDELPDSTIDSISVSFGEPVESAIPGAPPKLSNKSDGIRAVEKRDMTGRYLGSIESSNEFLPVITNIVPVGDKNVAVAGQYFMSEYDAIIIGELSGCDNSSGNVLTCQWRDQYGMGGVDFVFTPDYAAFSGRWSVSGKEGAYKWSGIKVEK